MKTGTTLITITITMLLLALPAGAADFTLGVFGNANGDEMINMQDVTYTELIILEYKDETQLADAKYDGEIDILDVTQIELTILGREKEITIIDDAERIVTVEKPVERIVSGHVVNSEAVKLLGAWDRVVGRDPYTVDELLFPGASELPVCSGPMAPDPYYETVFELDPDIYLIFYLPGMPIEEMVTTLEPEGISVVFLNPGNIETLVENIRKLQYVLNAKEKGEEYIAFYNGVVNDITDNTAGLSEAEKPQVFLWPFCFDYQDSYMVYGTATQGCQMDIVGGIDICKDVPGYYPYVSDEWVAGLDIDVIVGHVSPAVIPGIFGYDIYDTAVARETRDWVMDADENPALSGSGAVTDRRVYLCQTELAGSLRVIVNLAYMAKWFHPDLFDDDFDPYEIHMTYLTDYMGVDRSEVEESVLFWPEP